MGEDLGGKETLGEDLGEIEELRELGREGELEEEREGLEEEREGLEEEREEWRGEEGKEETEIWERSSALGVAIVRVPRESRVENCCKKKQKEEREEREERKERKRL